MRKRDDEISSQRRARTPLLYVALGAIFLLAVTGISLKAIASTPGVQVNMLLLAQASQGGNTQLPLQVRPASAVAFEAPELVLLDKTSVRAITPPQTLSASVLGALIGDSSLDSGNSREIRHYVIEEGDTITSLAERFGISADTIIWANNLNASSQLTPEEELLILPTSGALHLVRPGDTLSEIALWYKGDMDEILYFNEITDAKDIFVGDLLIIPGGIKPVQLPAGRPTQLAGGYFMMPVPRSYKITQGLHPFNAIDFANGTCGGPAYAAAGGVVQRVGYDDVAGNYARILHDNSVVTFYGHLSGQTVSSGERVGRGQIVGYIGHSGYTIPAGPGGCHLHFEVRGATNPFAK